MECWQCFPRTFQQDLSSQHGVVSRGWARLQSSSSRSPNPHETFRETAFPHDCRFLFTTIASFSDCESDREWVRMSGGRQDGRHLCVRAVSGLSWEAIPASTKRWTIEIIKLDRLWMLRSPPIVGRSTLGEICRREAVSLSVGRRVSNPGAV